MDSKMTADEVKEHFRLPGMEGCYLLLCDGPPVTVRSQQIRALNLLHAHAPNPEKANEITGKTIAVIGGGATGITFAAGAASLGGKVELFEKSSRLLHMQLGCWHRPLHPEIFTWPEDTAYRPVSHLPQLGWTTGRAHDVADTLLAQFAGIQAMLGGHPRKKYPTQAIKVHHGTSVQVTPDRHVILHETRRQFDLVVIAVGFGVEELRFPLPWNSYWRVDPLDQTLLGDDDKIREIVIVGTGDGALIEIIRSCLSTLEQGALLDSILFATLDDKKLAEEIRRIENNHPDDQRFEQYCALRNPAVERIILDNLRHDTRVYWMLREPVPYHGFSLPIHRFIVGQIVALQKRGEIAEKLSRPHDRLIELVPEANIVEVMPVPGPKPGGFTISYDQQGARKTMACDNAVVRYGAVRDPLVSGEDEKKPRGLLSTIGRTLATHSERDRSEILELIRRKRDKLDASVPNPSSLNNAHICCRKSQWLPGSAFEEALQAFDPRLQRVRRGGTEVADKPALRACFVKGFPRSPHAVYRIKAWLENLPALSGSLRITYELHPEYERPISRVAFGPRHEMWLNTDSNYKLRAKTNDGREWNLGSLADALLETSLGPEGLQAEVPMDNAPAEAFQVALGKISTTREQKDQEEATSTKGRAALAEGRSPAAE
jgi:hypothetical protein